MINESMLETSNAQMEGEHLASTNVIEEEHTFEGHYTNMSHPGQRRKHRTM